MRATIATASFAMLGRSGSGVEFVILLTSKRGFPESF
jgi:hypothetical protein